MSIERSALPLGDNQAQSRLDGAHLTLPLAKKDWDSARILMRRVMAPGGVTGVIMALVFIVATYAFLMAMRYFEELPPVSVTFLIPVVVAAIAREMAAFLWAIGREVVPA